MRPTDPPPRPPLLAPDEIEWLLDVCLAWPGVWRQQGFFEHRPGAGADPAMVRQRLRDAIGSICDHDRRLDRALGGLISLAEARSDWDTVGALYALRRRVSERARAGVGSSTWPPSTWPPATEPVVDDLQPRSVRRGQPTGSFATIEPPGGHRSSRSTPPIASMADEPDRGEATDMPAMAHEDASRGPWWTAVAGRLTAADRAPTLEAPVERPEHRPIEQISAWRPPSARIGLDATVHVYIHAPALSDAIRREARRAIRGARRAHARPARRPLVPGETIHASLSGRAIVTATRSGRWDPTPTHPWLRLELDFGVPLATVPGPYRLRVVVWSGESRAEPLDDFGFDMPFVDRRPLPRGPVGVGLLTAALVSGGATVAAGLPGAVGWGVTAALAGTGAGLVATRVPALASVERRPRRVFFCHARADAGWLDPVAAILRSAGHEAWIDRFDISAGAAWATTIRDAIDTCDRVYVFWSARAAGRPEVEREIGLALDRLTTRGPPPEADGRFIVPVILDDTPLPSPLSPYQWIDLRRPT